jgi:hypothetical protein
LVGGFGRLLSVHNISENTMHIKQATMVYKHPGNHKIHGSMFDYKIVSAEAEEEGGKSQLDQALADGWFKMPTRAELEEKAVELDIKFQANWKDGTLFEKINEVLEKGE